MPVPLTVGTATAAPGTRADGVIPCGTDALGREEALPVIVVNGAADGPVLWLDGCIHGDEPEGPLAIHLLLRDLDPATLRGAVVAVPVVNVPAFLANNRGNPLDAFTPDMNRIYPGRPDGFASERVAAAHARWLREVADMELSIHSGGRHSYLAQALFYTDSPAGQELAKAMGPGWDLILRGGVAPTGSPMAVMGSLDRPALTVELGGMCATLPDEFRANGRALADAALNILRHYRMIDGAAEYAGRWHVGHQVLVLAPATGLWVAEPGFRFRTTLAKDTPLARIYDLYGHERAVVRAPVDGQVFGLHTNPTVIEGEWACFYGEIEETIE